jgi:hypothetical protein
MHYPISGLKFLNPTFLLHFCVKTSVLATQQPPPTRAETEDFLRRLRAAMGEERPTILLELRTENIQGLQDLKLRDVHDCIPYITALTPEHFSHVVLADPYNDSQAAADGRHLWVFGVLVSKKKKLRPAYVKIQLGNPLANSVCISFHPPKYPLAFRFPSDHSIQFQLIYNA